MIIAFTLIDYTASSMLIFPLLIGSINIEDVYKSSLKIVFNYCLIFIFLEVLGWYFVLNHKRNHFISNSIAFLDVLVFGYYYYSIIKSNIQKKIITGLLIFALLLMIWASIGKDYNVINSFSQSIANIYLIFLSLLFFYQLLNSLEITNLFTYPHFWVGTAILIYFSGIFFIYIFSEFIVNNKSKNITQYWQIKDYLLLLFRILIGVGLYYSKELVENKTVIK